jgi:type VI protein secretion system component VasK
MIDYLTEALAAVRRNRRLLRIRLTVEAAGLTVTFAATARLIETGRPWWLLTIAFWLIAVWAAAVFRTRNRLQEVNADLVKLDGIVQETNQAADVLRAFGLPDEVVHLFTGAPATATTTDDDPDSTPAPTAPEPRTPRT